MEKTIKKTRMMTSYNVTAGETVIAKADCWPVDEPGSGYVIEIVPYEGQPERAGILLKERDMWDDFYDSEENSEIPPEIEQIRYLLSTMISDPQQLRECLNIRRRNDVFDIKIEKQEYFFNLIMICQYSCDVSGNKTDKGIFIYDSEEHDTWHFPLGTLDTEILRIIDPSLIIPVTTRSNDRKTNDQ
ncbi:hypothetical protein ACFQZI_06735 [Mucilaginibacter lutimaris]|uniref:Uncharacterized protein n=1 Tax=Mucilaginibacter lutimaris TaxID=931629 RepID=A0ABW2ZED1_9SPHI